VCRAMSAMYRAGRQTHAVYVLRQVRTRLATDFGLEPSPDLQRLHAAILRHEDEVAAGHAPSTTGPPAAARPAQPPAPPPDLTRPGAAPPAVGGVFLRRARRA